MSTSFRLSEVFHSHNANHSNSMVPTKLSAIETPISIGLHAHTRRLACDVVSHTRDSDNLVHNPPRGLLQEVESELVGLGSHEVD